MLAGVTDCRRSQKWGCRGGLVLGFKPSHSSHTQERTTQVSREGGEDHTALAEWGLRSFGESQDHVALGYSFLPRGLGSRRDFAGKKKGERTLAGGL